MVTLETFDKGFVKNQFVTLSLFQSVTRYDDFLQKLKTEIEEL